MARRADAGRRARATLYLQAIRRPRGLAEEQKVTRQFQNRQKHMIKSYAWKYQRYPYRRANPCDASSK